METIIGVLALVLFAVFKGIEKKLNASGRGKVPGQPRNVLHGGPLAELEVLQMPEIPEIPEVPQMREEPEVESPAPYVAPVPVAPPVSKVVQKPKTNAAARKTVRTETKNKEKFDPKKMIVYSEIMKTKF